MCYFTCNTISHGRLWTGVETNSALGKQDGKGVLLTSMLNPSGPVPPRFNFMMRDAEAILRKNNLSSNRLLKERAITYKCMSEMYPKMHWTRHTINHGVGFRETGRLTFWKGGSYLGVSRTFIQYI